MALNDRDSDRLELLDLANAGDDVHAIGSLAPLVSGLGCVVIKPDGSRYLAGATPDPLA
jgi:hypothetical protein